VQHKRVYLHNHLAAQVLGFNHGEWWGLERHYNSFLMGQAGRNMTVFGPDGIIATQRFAPVHGANVVTTLDLNIQRLAEEVVAKWSDMTGAVGAVIVMCPHTGEVFAMAQCPGFDANNPSSLEGLTTNDAAYLESLAALDPASEEFFNRLFRVWANFNISSTFEPGSIYKSMTAAKALDMGVIGPNQTFYCGGSKEINGVRVRCHIFPRSHGQINLTQALAVSCNVAHMDIAAEIGRDAFWRYQRDFGFGWLTGIDLPGENAGIIFTPGQLNDLELATSSFGQRFTATPLQAVAAYAPLINGGNVVRPHVVSQVVSADNSSTLFSRDVSPQRRIIAPSVSDWMRQALASVITDNRGTARGAAIDGLTQGGKTGTAEQGLRELSPDVPNPNFSWSISYVGYFPVENPQFLVLTLLHDIPVEVYEGGFTSVVPMYKEMAEGILEIRNGAIGGRTLAASAGSSSVVTPNLVGLGVQNAINELNNLGLVYHFIGSGNFVASQFPPAPIVLNGGAAVTLFLEDDGRAALVPVPDVAGLLASFAGEILAQHGFVPRNIHLSEQVGNNSDLMVYGQMPQGISLPAGTDILLMVREVDQ
jgi:stage V sporulation protein D (sporulation-specific penicillin-binding protein)